MQPYFRRARLSRLADRIRHAAPPVTPKDLESRLNEEALRYFNLTGEEFRDRYLAGAIPEPDRAEVIRVAMLIAPSIPPRHRTERGWLRNGPMHVGKNHT